MGLTLAVYGGWLFTDHYRLEGVGMNVLLIEAILDRYVAKAQRRIKDWSPAEIEVLLLKLREEVLDCLR